MSLERVRGDGWLQAFVLIAAFSGGLWLFSRRAEPKIDSPAAAPAAAAPAPAGRKRPKDGKQWIVDGDGAPGADTETLAEAVTAASAGDRILLRRGMHHGSAVLDKALTVAGDGKPGETVLAGSGPFTLSARGGATVTVENLTVSAPKGPNARAVEVREKSTMRLVRGSYNGYGADAAVIVESDSSLEAEGTEFNGGNDTALFVHGRARLKGCTLLNGKTLVSALGAGANFEDEGGKWRYAEIGLATGGRARAVLTGPSFESVQLEAIALSDSQLKLIDPVFDRAKPQCLARGGRAECGK